MQKNQMRQFFLAHKDQQSRSATEVRQSNPALLERLESSSVSCMLAVSTDKMV
jgi:hypothetical protein